MRTLNGWLSLGPGFFSEQSFEFGNQRATIDSRSRQFQSGFAKSSAFQSKDLKSPLPSELVAGMPNCHWLYVADQLRPENGVLVFFRFESELKKCINHLQQTGRSTGSVHVPAWQVWGYSGLFLHIVILGSIAAMTAEFWWRSLHQNGHNDASTLLVGIGVLIPTLIAAKREGTYGAFRQFVVWKSGGRASNVEAREIPIAKDALIDFNTAASPTYLETIPLDQILNVSLEHKRAGMMTDDIFKAIRRQPSDRVALWLELKDDEVGKRLFVMPYDAATKWVEQLQARLPAGVVKA